MLFEYVILYIIFIAFIIKYWIWIVWNAYLNLHRVFITYRNLFWSLQYSELIKLQYFVKYPKELEKGTVDIEYNF
jgi:hypothetical protein